MPSYKLTYFPLRARAEVIRLAFAYNDIAFEDNRVPGGELIAARASGAVKTPFGQFPILEVTEDDGSTTTLGQSVSIARFVARLGDGSLLPADLLQAAVVESVIEQVVDIINAVAPAIFGPAEGREALKETLKGGKVATLFKGIFDLYAGKKFLLGDNLCLADLFLFVTEDLVLAIGMKPEDVNPAYPAVLKAVAEHPRLTKYLASRPAL